MYRSLNKKAFVNEINKLVPGVNKKDIKVREAGVRAQAVDKDGKPVMQTIDVSALIPVLTGAIKEAIAKIETLEAEVKALKG